MCTYRNILAPLFILVSSVCLASTSFLSVPNFPIPIPQQLQCGSKWANQIGCLEHINCGLSPSNAACCESVKSQSTSCFGCGPFDPSQCTFALNKNTSCDLLDSSMTMLQSLSCHCSECLQYLVLSKFQSFTQSQGINPLLRGYETSLAQAFTKMAKLDQNACQNAIYCEQQSLNFGVSGFEEILPKLKSFELLLQFCENDPPTLTGLDPYFALGKSICPSGATDKTDCVSILQGEDVATWIQSRGVLVADTSQTCGFKTFSDNFDAVLTVPILAEIFVQKDKGGSINAGIYIPFKLPFSFHVGIEYNTDFCSGFDPGQTFHISSHITTYVNPSTNSKNAAVGPLLMQINNAPSDFEKKLIYTALYDLEGDMHNKLDVDRKLQDCWSEFLSQIPSFDCTITVSSEVPTSQCVPAAQTKKATSRNCGNFTTAVGNYFSGLPNALLQTAESILIP